jgi:hypothetical protein
MSGERTERRFRTIVNASALVMLAGGAVVLAACSNPERERTAGQPAMLQPVDEDIRQPGAPRPAGSLIDLTKPGAVVWQTATPSIESTLDIAQQKQITRPWTGIIRSTEGIEKGAGGDEPPELPDGAPNGLVAGHINPNGFQIKSKGLFPGIGQTPWTPPDPTLGVGPNHVLATVNMSIAWWTKAGALQFSSNLDNTGSPGFFEGIGAGNFTFDPKCAYDHYAGRYVVIVPETYGNNQAWMCIAVSDDSDPNGVWYKYRTDMVVTVGSDTFWLDYPGFGYDQNAYYITGNLFGLNNGGFAGTAYRVFNKTPLLSGQPVQYATLRDGSISSVQVAQSFGNPTSAFFVATASSSSLRVQAITNPTTSPALVSTTVNVPSFGGAMSAPTADGTSVGAIDGRIMNVHWRNGNLYAAHDIGAGGVGVARWYHMQTNNWPTSGNVSLVQSGNVSPGNGKYTFFPAIYSNKFNDVAMVVGASSATERISVNGVGRKASDPAGTMGPLTELKMSGASGGGRWGDYQDIAVDPVDDATFWVIGETAESGGWGTWIDKFTITTTPGPSAGDDLAGNVFSGTSVTIDVMANDSHNTGQPFTIQSFDATSEEGGTIVRSVGTGPGGRDQLTYTAPSGHLGADSFEYVIADATNATDTGLVTLTVLDPALFRDPENPSNADPAAEVKWYSYTSNQTVIPNYDTMTPYLETTIASINQNSTVLNFMNSTRSNLVGGRFTGYIEVPSNDFYVFTIESDDGSRFYIGDDMVIDHDGVHTFSQKDGSIGLKAGKHAFRVDYFENTLQAGLRLYWSSSTLPKAIIPASAYFHGGTVCAADFDGSGFVDIEDYTAFVLAFEAGTNDADFDGSGFVDIEDFTGFVVAFEAGC